MDQAAIDAANGFSPTTATTTGLEKPEKPEPAPAEAEAVEPPGLDELPPLPDNPPDIAAAEPAVPGGNDGTGAEAPSGPADGPVSGPSSTDGEETGTAGPYPRSRLKKEIVPRIGGLPLPDETKKRQDEQESIERLKRRLSKIPFMFQLPDSVKNSLPEIHISFHSYSRKPAARLVSINGKIVREGQQFENDLTLEEITPEGVVMVYKSRRFRINI